MALCREIKIHLFTVGFKKQEPKHSLVITFPCEQAAIIVTKMHEDLIGVLQSQQLTFRLFSKFSAANQRIYLQSVAQ